MIRINLLSRDQRPNSGGAFRLDRMRVVPLLLLGAVLSACLVTTVVQDGRVKTLSREVETARTEVEGYRRTIHMIDEFVRKEKELVRRLDLVRDLDRDRFRTVGILDEVARRLPDHVWLTSLRETGPGRIAIQGVAYSNLMVSELMEALGESDRFTEVELSLAKRRVVEGQDAVDFTVTSGIRAAPEAD
ncbi:MAG: PilN domain-containing protein [Gemmatimonadota bacterium]|jgi:type IV pilus assembly protein PilN|nr:hypothetical protein [Gemmatimonadota bacterium]MDP6461505.1 PilN domain-containing protein [Gemmatimonadota bacterium]MDP6529293.1 PilN domain-containing protein [Gemmatimonadota bacterium]MDP6802178.1 PilN domain-containing protein [Gemmatimonadota bacterium]MDP7031508.1 PilN domain-containing protein [Gemmatimonadota bacterium]